MKKRLGSLLLCAVLCLLLLPVTGFAEETEAGLEWSWDSGGTLWVSCQGEMDLSGGIPWADMKQDVVKLQVAEGVTSIGEEAF